MGPHLPQTWLLREGFEIDLTRQQAVRDGEIIRLTRREAEVLRCLYRHDGQAVSVDRLHQEVWGLAPGEASRAAQSTLHRLRRKLERDPSSPEFLLTVAGSAVRLALRSSSRLQLRPTAPLIGRDALVDDVRTQLAAHRVVTLTGLGGIGKTRLAWAVMEAGDTFVDLVAVHDLDTVLQRLAAELGLHLWDEPVEQLGRALAARGPQRVVLDNVEQITDTVSELLHRWLDVAPATRWLVTSRKRLGVYGEVVLSVPPLATPLPGQDPSASPAVQLFLEAAPSEPGDLDAVAELVLRLQGIPLALELAAARTSALDLAGLLHQLDSGIEVLAKDGEGRHDTVERTVAWSWSLLDEEERSVLAQCAVFQTPFRLEAAEAVVRTSPDRQLLDVMQTLVDASLLHPLPHTSPRRIRPYQVVQAFVRSRQTDPDAPLRHARFFAERCRTLPVEPSERSARDDELRQALGDLQAAMAVALAARDRSTTLDLARGLVIALGRVAPLQAGPAVHAALELAGQAAELAHQRVALRSVWAATLIRSFRWEEARQVYAAAQQEAVDPLQLAELGKLEVYLLSEEGHTAEARDAAASLLERGLTDRSELLTLAGVHTRDCGELEEAKALLEQAIDVASRPASEADARRNLAVVLANLGHPDQAFDQAQHAVRIMGEVDEPYVLGVVLVSRANVLLLAGRVREADDAFVEAADQLGRLGLPPPVAVIANRARIALELGDPVRARHMAAEAARRARTRGSTRIEGSCLEIEGNALLFGGDAQAALGPLDAAAACLPPSHGRRVYLDLTRAIAAARSGRVDARQLLLQAGQAAGADHPSAVAYAWVAEAEVELAHDDTLAAAAALAQARALIDAHQVFGLEELLTDLSGRLAR